MKQIDAVIQGIKPFYLSRTQALDIQEMLREHRVDEIRREAARWQENMRRFFH